MVVITLARGHLLGSSEVEKRSALAIGTIARNLGLACIIHEEKNKTQKIRN